MDKFPQYTQVESCSPPDQAPPGLVMDYYDGNTVTAMWNYAQHFAMSDNSYDTDVRPVHAGRAQPDLGPDARHDRLSFLGTTANGTVIGDADPGLRRLLGRIDHPR